MQEAREEGREEGKAEGLNEGELLGMREVAQRTLGESLSRLSLPKSRRRFRLSTKSACSMWRRMPGTHTLEQVRVRLGLAEQQG